MAIDSSIFVVLERCRKDIIFKYVSRGPKNRKNRLKWRPGADTRQKSRPPGVDFREPGSQGAALFTRALTMVRGKTVVYQFEQAKGKKESWQAKQEKVRRGI